MDHRSRIVLAATELLEASPNGDISTRGVGEKAGVQQPVIYRLFGDKDGLLSAVVDHGFGEYLAAKRAAVPTSDPVADLRRGWEEHTRFALEHPNLYRLMYTPGLASAPRSVGEAHELLRSVLERVARAGRLAIEPDRAAEIVISANSGVALALLTRPELHRSVELSTHVREIVLAGILTPEPDGGTPPEPPAVPQAANTLAALLRSAPPESFSPAERELLAEWLTRLAHGPKP
ncbi:TetR/AcrR family transcriptional regulator [Nonomuraea jiangxiensis]|uniref:DNA-binding transcriptional regulator, AcrR family n=1 Tax=Nonomuraea jiangxiensis TaxID=633440 RepID=A0A1G9EUJ4_9ACTN|nr:TetR/AcrR family transcriptional regulator [Nonomuraea jiangxiensis]SDK79790.1 DNA-binding transcriptional regulator, AcrR family [Nonomuraea jiangxiensis]